MYYRVSQFRQKIGADLNQSINEPTKTPVSARLAGWQQKVDTVEKEKPSQPIFKTPGKIAPSIGVGAKVRHNFDFLNYTNI
jgi:hypothetical protein